MVLNVSVDLDVGHESQKSPSRTITVAIIRLQSGQKYADAQLTVESTVFTALEHLYSSGKKKINKKKRPFRDLSTQIIKKMFLQRNHFFVVVLVSSLRE